ncbi:hypothetical protein ACQP1W_39235 [Spirillospora sp. CA-255316]
MTSRAPERIGGHRLLCRLGEGGQGVVYLAATGTGPGDRVAIKLFHERAGTRATLFKETSTARKVASFCTARLLDVGEEAGAPFVVTEFIDGRPCPSASRRAARSPAPSE